MSSARDEIATLREAAEWAERQPADLLDGVRWDSIVDLYQLAARMGVSGISEMIALRPPKGWSGTAHSWTRWRAEARLMLRVPA